MSKYVVSGASTGRERRRKSIRKKVHGTGNRPRLSVFRANKNMECQVINDDLGTTLVSASTKEKEFKEAGKMNKKEAAAKLGEIIAERTLEKGVDNIVFDRGGYKYHGRVEALAEAARSKGLKF